MLYLLWFVKTNFYNCPVPEIPMCDPLLLAAILEELGYLDEKKEKDKKDEIHDEGSDKNNSNSSGQEEK